MSNTPEVIEDDPIEVRKAKRQAMLDAGENPMAMRSTTATIWPSSSSFTRTLRTGIPPRSVKVAGRIMSKRVQGKIAFLGLRDATGDMQLFCRINELGEEAFGRLKDLDVGDWIGVEGAMMRHAPRPALGCRLVLRAAQQVHPPAAREVPRPGGQGERVIASATSTWS